jgi:hypothetical protein
VGEVLWSGGKIQRRRSEDHRWSIAQLSWTDEPRSRCKRSLKSFVRLLIACPTILTVPEICFGQALGKSVEKPTIKWCPGVTHQAARHRLRYQAREAG